MANELRVNGNMLSWSSTILRVNGIQQHWPTSISYNDKLEHSKTYGQGRHHGPRGRSAGKYSADNAKLKGPKADVQGFIDYLASLSSDGVSYGTVEFDIVLQFIESTQAVTIEIEGCKYAGTSSSDEEGPDALQDEIELDVMRIRRNGKTLFDSTPAL